MLCCSADPVKACCDTVPHDTAQHSTAQHSTAQHSTAQHSTAQHSTAQVQHASNDTNATVLTDNDRSPRHCTRRSQLHCENLCGCTGTRCHCSHVRCTVLSAARQSPTKQDCNAPITAVKAGAVSSPLSTQWLCSIRRMQPLEDLLGNKP